MSLNLKTAHYPTLQELTKTAREQCLEHLPDYVCKYCQWAAALAYRAVVAENRENANLIQDIHNMADGCRHGCHVADAAAILSRYPEVTEGK